MATVKFEISLDTIIFEVNGTDSFTDIETVLLEHCEEILWENHSERVVEYSVYFKHFLNDRSYFEHIGYVQLGMDNNGYFTITHLTVDGRTLQNYWHPLYFYKGECRYGFENE